LPTAPTPITALPTPPDSVDTVNFSPRTDVFLGQLAEDTVDEMNALGTNAYNNAVEAVDAATTATTKATEAAASAASAVNAPGTSATSTTSLAVGSGSKSIFVQTGKNFAPGQPIRVALTSAPSTTWMQAIADDYDSVTGQLDFTASTFAGTGTHSDWTVSLTGPDALPAATVAEVRAGTAGDKAVPPASLSGSAAFQTLTDAATVNWDVALGYNAYLTLEGNRTMAAPTNMQDGLPYQLFIDQGVVGSRTLSWNAIFDWRDLGPPTLSTGVGKVDIASGTYCAATGKLHMTGFSKAAA
jgi:hypothetical protein